MGAPGAPAHLLPLAHAVVNKMAHDRFDSRCGNALAFGSRPRKVWHRASIPADIPCKATDHIFDSVSCVAAVIAARAQPTDRVALEAP
jgi:hypothetical protein